MEKLYKNMDKKRHKLLRRIEFELWRTSVIYKYTINSRLFHELLTCAQDCQADLLTVTATTADLLAVVDPAQDLIEHQGRSKARV